jgi:hypothetical protein
MPNAHPIYLKAEHRHTKAELGTRTNTGEVENSSVTVYSLEVKPFLGQIG